MDYKDLIFKDWRSAVNYAIKKKLWGKVVVVKKGEEQFVIEDKE